MTAPIGENVTPDLIDAYRNPEHDAPPVPQGEPPRENWRDRRTARTATAKAAPKSRVKEPPSKKGEFIEPLTDLYNMVGMGVTFLEMRGAKLGPDGELLSSNGKPYHNCADTITDNAVRMAEAWDDLAQKNDSVRRTLRKLTQGTAWGGVITAHIPIALAIASNHMPGAVPSRSIVAPEPVAESTPEPPTAAAPVRRRPTKRTAPTKTNAAEVNRRRSTATDGG